MVGREGPAHGLFSRFQEFYCTAVLLLSPTFSHLSSPRVHVLALTTHREKARIESAAHCYRTSDVVKQPLPFAFLDSVLSIPPPSPNTVPYIRRAMRGGGGWSVGPRRMEGWKESTFSYPPLSRHVRASPLALSWTRNRMYFIHTHRIISTRCCDETVRTCGTNV